MWPSSQPKKSPGCVKPPSVLCVWASLPIYFVMNQGDAVCLWNYCAPRCWCWGAFRFTPVWILLLSRGVYSDCTPTWCVHCGCFLRWVHGPLWCVYGGSTLLLAPVPRPHPLIIRYRTPPPICPPTPSQTFRMELGPSVSFQTSSTVDGITFGIGLEIRWPQRLWQVLASTGNLHCSPLKLHWLLQAYMVAITGVSICAKSSKCWQSAASICAFWQSGIVEAFRDRRIVGKAGNCSPMINSILTNRQSRLWWIEYPLVRRNKEPIFK